MLIPDDEADYLIFRGTQVVSEPAGSIIKLIRNSWDIIRNLRIWPWPVKIKGSTYKGHAGFIRGAVRVARFIRPQLRKNKPLVVAGHSLGGAIALVVGLLVGRGKPVNIITLGCPRVFWSPVKIPENAKITMYRCGRDIVSYIPLGRHPVPLTVVGKPKKLWPSTADHRIREYIRAIKEISGEQNAN